VELLVDRRAFGKRGREKNLCENSSGSGRFNRHDGLYDRCRQKANAGKNHHPIHGIYPTPAFFPKPVADISEIFACW